MKDIIPLLEINNICKTRRYDGQTVEVLQDVSLTFTKGQISLLIGPSGGGKSSLLRLLNRLDEPSVGQIRYQGRSLEDWAPVRLRREIAMLMQKPVMFVGTVLDNLQKPFLLQKKTPPGAESVQVEEVMAQCRLEKAMLSRNAQSLSIGQQQRVGLARALISGPQVLLLDEPTSALDRPTGDLLAGTLREICLDRDLTVIMATHDLRLAEQLDGALVFIENGRVVEEGPTAQLLNHPGTEALRRFLAEPDFSRNGNRATEATG